MAEYLKRGATAEAKAGSDRTVRHTVEGILAVSPRAAIWRYAS